MKKVKNKNDNATKPENKHSTDDDDGLNTLTINQDYAKKFEYMRRRQELEKAEAKFGKDAVRCKYLKK